MIVILMCKLMDIAFDMNFFGCKGVLGEIVGMYFGLGGGGGILTFWAE